MEGTWDGIQLGILEQTINMKKLNLLAKMASVLRESVQNDRHIFKWYFKIQTDENIDLRVKEMERSIMKWKMANLWDQDRSQSVRSDRFMFQNKNKFINVPNCEKY